jgi:CRP/FNR family cyclic AMP-dependent transcriptional regulator
LTGPRNLKKGEILFREGDPSDCMYVIKSGSIAIMKTKGSGEISLAELRAGDMLGEMAFFDNKPRSAGARALEESVVIELPFKALNTQFKTFPEWLKAIMRTVNNHLRNANQKIKNLERSGDEETTVFPPHTITRLIAILAMVTLRYGEREADGSTTVPSGTLRKYTIQIFQQATNKMQKISEILQAFGHMKIEDLGEGRQKIIVHHLDFFFNFVDFYNEYLFKEEAKRTSVEEKHMKPIAALLFYGKKQTPNEKGFVKVNLTEMQNSSMKDLGHLFSVSDTDLLAEKGLVQEKLSEAGGFLSCQFNLLDLETIYPYWELIHALKKITKAD